MRKIGTIGLLVAGVTLGAITCTAEDTYKGWTGRLWIGGVMRTLERDNVTFTDPTFGTVELSADQAVLGIGADVEYRFSKLLGLDLAIGYADLEVDFDHSVGSGTQTDNLGMLPIWLALNFHMVNTDRFDVYAGYQMAYVHFFNDLSYDVPGVGKFNYGTDDEFAPFGFIIATDIAVSENWDINLAFRFQDIDGDSDHNLPIDPTFITVGVAHRL